MSIKRFMLAFALAAALGGCASSGQVSAPIPACSPMSGETYCN